MLYMFNIVEEYDNIYIEVRNCLDGELKMTIDAKKIIPKLSVPLEEWEKFKKIRNWGALIRETTAALCMRLVVSLIQQHPNWKMELSKICGRDGKELKEAGIRRHDSVSGVKYIERYREIYGAREATVYLYASRRDAST